MQNVARATIALLKLNRFLLGSIRELLREKEKVACVTFCSKWKSTLTGEVFTVELEVITNFVMNKCDLAKCFSTLTYSRIKSI